MAINYSVHEEALNLGMLWYSLVCVYGFVLFCTIISIILSIQDYTTCTMDIYMRQIWHDDRMAFNESNLCILYYLHCLYQLYYLYYLSYYCKLFSSLQDYTMDIYMRQIWQDERMAFTELNSTIVLPAKAMENVRKNFIFFYIIEQKYSNVAIILIF